MNPSHPAETPFLGAGLFAASLFMFGIGILASFVLIFSTWFTWRRQVRGKKTTVDVSEMVPHRTILHCSLSALLLLECATVVWDTVTRYRHFPIVLRWPVDMLVIAAVSYSGLQMFRMYVHAYAAAKIEADIRESLARRPAK